MRVLLVSSKYMPEYAGSGLRAHRTYLRLREKYDVEFEVLAGSVTSDRPRAYELDGVPVKVIASRRPSLPLLPERLRARAAASVAYWRVALPAFRHMHANRKRFDVVHVFGKAHVPGAAVTFAKAFRRPLMVELVNLTDKPDQSEPRFLSALLGRGYPRRTVIVCLSKALQDACIGAGYREEQTWVRPNPVDETRFYFDRDRRNEYRASVTRFQPSDIVLVYLAKFIPRKNQRFLVQALSRLPDRFKLLLVGPLETEGPLGQRDRRYFDSILALTRQARLQRRVQIIPNFVHNPEAYLKSADAFLMPADGEAFGTPFAEALACGLPVVANDLPGVFDQWIRPGENGFLCPLDEALWAEKIALAAAIPQRAMRRASEAVLRGASTAAIDAQYYERLTALAAAP